MKKSTLCILLIFSFLFLQCRTTPVDIVKKRVWHATPNNFLNFQEFKTGRNLMLNTFSPDVMENDSIIILEYFADSAVQYYCTIYESKDHSCKKYSTTISKKRNRYVINSLETANYKDYILPMVLHGQLDEIIEQGRNSISSPGSLIINILKKNETKMNFKVKTIITKYFYPDDAF